MSELNFVFGFGFLASVAFFFFLGEHPEIRAAARHDRPVLQASPGVTDAAVEDATIDASAHAHLATNTAAINILKSYEGLSLEAYPEADYWLIGYGYKNPSIHAGMSISPKTAERYLRDDLKAREDFVRSVVKVPVNENEFSALVALSYNIGNGSLKNSTALRLLNEGDRRAAADAFMMWNKVKRDGVLMDSTQLTARREAERDLFLAR